MDTRSIQWAPTPYMSPTANATAATDQGAAGPSGDSLDIGAGTGRTETVSEDAVRAITSGTAEVKEGGGEADPVQEAFKDISFLNSESSALKKISASLKKINGTQGAQKMAECLEDYRQVASALDTMGHANLYKTAILDNEDRRSYLNKGMALDNYVESGGIQIPAPDNFNNRYLLKSGKEAMLLCNLLTGNLEGLSPEDREVYEKLKAFQESRGEFYFRGSMMMPVDDFSYNEFMPPNMPTDAIGAFLLFKRGTVLETVEPQGRQSYIFGDGGLIWQGVHEQVDNAQILKTLAKHESPATLHIWNKISEKGRELISGAKLQSAIPILNQMIVDRSFYDPHLFNDGEPSPEARALIESGKYLSSEKASRKLNRLLLQSVFPGNLPENPRSIDQLDCVLKNPEPVDDTRVLVAALLEKIKNLGYTPGPDMTKPPFNMPTDPMAAMGWTVANRCDMGATRKILIEQLLAGEKINLTRTGSVNLTGADYTLSLDQLIEFIKKEKGTTSASMESFLSICNTLEERGSRFFVRMEDNSVRGSLVPLNRDRVIPGNEASEAAAKMMKGQRLDYASAYFLLQDRGEMVILSPDGALATVSDLDDLQRYMTQGTVADRTGFVDRSAPKANMLMTYFVEPFAPSNILGYDDTPARATKIGSNEQVDMVFLRSDMPEKKNLLYEYLQKGEAQVLERLDPSRSMNDPALLSEFVYRALHDHPDDTYIRFLVAGHGGAEKGLLPDGEHNNAEANHAMSVDDFARGVHEGVRRFNGEHGSNRTIDNLFLASCLMGNTSYIYALSKYGDVRYLNASPEVMMGNDPNVFFEYVSAPETAGSTAEQFARDMVDKVVAAPCFPSGKTGEHESTFGKIYGAYDLDPAKGARFMLSLKRFAREAERLMEDGTFRSYMQEDIKKIKPYLTNIPMLFGPRLEQRDLIEVCDRFLTDERLGDRHFKRATERLKSATEALVVYQRGADKEYTQRGPSIFFPTELSEKDDVYMSTSLMKESGFDRFLKKFARQDSVNDSPQGR